MTDGKDDDEMDDRTAARIVLRSWLEGIRREVARQRADEKPDPWETIYRRQK